MNNKVLILRFALLVVLSITGCSNVATSNPTPIPDVAPTAMPDPTATLPTEKPLFVAFAKNGDLHLWDSVSKQSHLVLKSGDVTHVMMSDDGQVIAFTRSASSFEPLLVEHSALWAVDSNGENPRELISDETLRQIMNPPPEDSAGFAQISWLPGTHRLVYSTMKFHAPGQGFTNSKDIYVVDADTGSNVVLATDIMPDTPFLNAWSFVISPDSQQIAMFSATELSFINTDGSNLRRAVLTYLTVGMGDAILLPKGVWTKDSTAFVFTGPIESDSPFVLNYTIWRVPADGSQPQSLATIMNSHSNHITFSPDGQRIVFYQDINGDGTIQTEEHRIMPLTAGAGPLALPSSHELVRWSPDGEAFVVKDLDLFQLCPEATNLSEVCGDPIPLASGSNLIDGIGWVDEDRFLYRALEPTSFFLGRLDGTILPIGNWTDDDALEGWSFYVPH